MPYAPAMGNCVHVIASFTLCVHVCKDYPLQRLPAGVDCQIFLGNLVSL